MAFVTQAFLFALSFFYGYSFRLDHNVPFIIGGSEVDPVGSFPFQGSLQLFEDHRCGSTLISEDWALTAAHCVDGINIDDMSVVFGAHDIVTQAEGNPTRFFIDELIIEPGWDWKEEEANDTAVMRLSTPADTSDEFIGTIRMAEEDEDDFVGYECYITGWGAVFRTDGGQSIVPNLLQVGPVEVYTYEDCDAIYGGGLINEAGHICVGTPGEVGACFGDSGGPAFCVDDSGEYVQVGITSWGAETIGNDTCPPEYPSVYTRVSFYREWVREVTGV